MKEPNHDPGVRSTSRSNASNRSFLLAVNNKVMIQGDVWET